MWKFNGMETVKIYTLTHGIVPISEELVGEVRRRCSVKTYKKWEWQDCAEFFREPLASAVGEEAERWSRTRTTILGV